MQLKPETTLTSLESTMEAGIAREIQKRIDEDRERIVGKARDEFEDEVRSIVGAVAINLSSYYSVEHLGGQLVIRVDTRKLR